MLSHLVQFDGQDPYELIIDAQDLNTVTELGTERVSA